MLEFTKTLKHLQLYIVCSNSWVEKNKKFKLLAIKTETCEIKNVLDEINYRLDAAEKMMNLSSERRQSKIIKTNKQTNKQKNMILRSACYREKWSLTGNTSAKNKSVGLNTAFSYFIYKNWCNKRSKGHK